MSDRVEIPLVDVVNFNADGSCLPAKAWLSCLEGGRSSLLCRWLRAFVELDKPVTLGWVGATAADIVALNPEAVDLVNGHPSVFEVILRPFGHDIGLLRTPSGFRVNFELGREVLTSTFDSVTPCFLPPEFMLTNEQISILADAGVSAVFIKPDRFSEESQKDIPSEPYIVEGILGGSLACIPVAGSLTEAYLSSIQLWESGPWNRAATSQPASVVTSWRDGESWLLLPDGLSRERAWLETESPTLRRTSVRDAIRRVVPTAPLVRDGERRGYPVHSFANWVKEFRMLGYLRRVREVERHITELPRHLQVLWLQAINSDVLSAVEKEAPRVKLRTAPAGTGDSRICDFTIRRSDRGREGEEFLALLERYEESEEVRRYLRDSPLPHMVKLRARLGWFLERTTR